MKDVSLLVLNGPGLANLSDRQSGAPRDLTLDQTQDACNALCDELGVTLDFRQTDDLSEFDRWINEDAISFDALIVNPHVGSSAPTAAQKLSQSAVNKLASLKKPLIEVHIENIFRAGNDFIEPLHEPHGDVGLVCGLGLQGYLLAIHSTVRKLKVSSS